MSVFLVLLLSLDRPTTPPLEEVQRVYDAVVQADGNVDYQQLKDNPDHIKALERYAAFMAGFSGEGVDADTRIAYYANAYNVFTLLGVTRAWPVTSVRKIRPLFGFFTKDEWNVGGKVVSLNHLEKKLLRPLDPRIHFIINCASASCPVLDPKVFTPENVQSAMARLAEAFISDETKNRFESNGKWHLSKIFEWYRDDWGKEKDVVAYIRKVRPDLRAPKKIRYLEYDWALNAAKP